LAARRQHESYAFWDQCLLPGQLDGGRRGMPEQLVRLTAAVVENAACDHAGNTRGSHSV
jgi:hypothetical protein